MPELDERILRHADVPYDPQKAHEYYLRTRELKGRKTTTSPSASSRGPAAVKKSGAQLAKKPVPKKHSNRPALQAQVVAIQGRLKVLQKTLNELLAEQADKKKPEKKAGSSKSGGSGGSSGSKHLTPKERADARQRSKDYYDKHKKPKAKERSVDEKIQLIRTQIRQMKETLAAAQAKVKAS